MNVLTTTQNNLSQEGLLKQAFSIHFILSKTSIEKIEISPAPGPLTFNTSNPHLQKQILAWLAAYQAKKETPLPPLDLSQLTPFQKDVLQATVEVPFGKTSTYKKIAEKIKRPKAYRAVGNALNQNPFPLLIPCHRILATQGLGGFAIGLELKKRLLGFEAG